ncbi:MAG: hypothetical protein WCF64_08270 [Methylocella sp.]
MTFNAKWDGSRTHARNLGQAEIHLPQLLNAEHGEIIVITGGLQFCGAPLILAGRFRHPDDRT